MAIIINDHMMKTAIMFAADHTEVIGIISMARVFFMSNAAQARKIHPASDVTNNRLKVTDSVFTRLIKPDSLFIILFENYYQLFPLVNVLTKNKLICKKIFKAIFVFELYA